MPGLIDPNKWHISANTDADTISREIPAPQLVGDSALIAAEKRTGQLMADTTLRNQGSQEGFLDILKMPLTAVCSTVRESRGLRLLYRVTGNARTPTTAP